MSSYPNYISIIKFILGLGALVAFFDNIASHGFSFVVRLLLVLCLLRLLVVVFACVIIAKVSHFARIFQTKHRLKIQP